MALRPAAERTAALRLNGHELHLETGTRLVCCFRWLNSYFFRMWIPGFMFTQVAPPVLRRAVPLDFGDRPVNLPVRANPPRSDQLLAPGLDALLGQPRQPASAGVQPLAGKSPEPGLSRRSCPRGPEDVRKPQRCKKVRHWGECHGLDPWILTFLATNDGPPLRSRRV